MRLTHTWGTLKREDSEVAGFYARVPRVLLDTLRIYTYPGLYADMTVRLLDALVSDIAKHNINPTLLADRAKFIELIEARTSRESFSELFADAARPDVPAGGPTAPAVASKPDAGRTPRPDKATPANEGVPRNTGSRPTQGKGGQADQAGKTRKG